MAFQPPARALLTSRPRESWMPITRQEPRPLAADFPNRAASDYSLAETFGGLGEPAPRQEHRLTRKIEAGGRRASEMPSWRSEAVWCSRQ